MLRIFSFHMKTYMSPCRVYISFLGSVGSRMLSNSSVPENVPTLLHQLEAKIKATGPITIADYMREVLTNPVSGYYQHQTVFGQSGDFVTSPEINQMFGEMISVWFLNEWHKIGSPKPLQIIELGPGKGTLIQDILKVLTHFNVKKDVSIHLVENSRRLSCIQAELLKVKIDSKEEKACGLHYKAGKTENGISVCWYSHVQDVPHEFSFIVANEFFDALPIHKFKRTKEGWREVLIDITPGTTVTTLRYVLSRAATPATLLIKPNEHRDHVEICPNAAVIIQHLASRIEEDGGIALFADYGYDGNSTDTFRAFRNHALHDPLVEPGTADITADVDFSLIREAAAPKVLTYGPVTQKQFLESLGINVRLQVLMKKCHSQDRKNLEASYHMLIDSDKMGERFKFFAMFPFVLKNHLTKFPVVGFTDTK